MEKQKLKKPIIGALMAALAVAIDLFFKYVVPSDGTSGLPFYSIPLSIGSMMIGPFYGIFMGIAADLGKGFLGPYGYKPLYMIAAISWSTVPGLIKGKKYDFLKMSFSLFLAYVIATLGNSFANWVYFGKEMLIGTIALRIITLIVSLPILIIINHIIYMRISHFETIDPVQKKSSYNPKGRAKTYKRDIYSISLSEAKENRQNSKKEAN